MNIRIINFIICERFNNNNIKYIYIYNNTGKEKLQIN